MSRSRSIVQPPEAAATLHPLAVGACQRGDFVLAEQIARQILAQDARDLFAWRLLSGLLAQSGRLKEAADACARAIAIDPLQAEIWMEAAGLHAQRADYPAVAEACRRAIALRPRWPEAHLNLGTALFRLAQPEAAEASFRTAIALQPAHPHAWRNLGAALRAQGDFTGAMAAYQKARGLAPDFAEAWRDEALLHLMLGDWATGWPMYEWRLRAELRGAPPLPGRLWHGEACAGETILLHAEQGLGDAIQFLRYVPEVARRARRVVLRVPPALQLLAQSIDAAVQVVTTAQPLPSYDRCAYLLSLPLILGATEETVSGAPYLRTPHERAATWRARMDAFPRPRVGLVWAGNPDPEVNPYRSVPFAALAPLLAMEGVSFMSLQYPKASPTLPSDLAPEIRDLADTAAILDELDLLVTVDTAVAHLAGALGRPVWVMLGHVADWRWQTGRADSPWYATMRLFRQLSRGDWGTVVAQVTKDLPGHLARPGISR